MKKINTSNVTSVSRQPFLGRSVSHVMDALTESFDSTIQGLIEDISLATILWGLGNATPAGATYTLSVGAIYFGGEIYEVDAQTVTVTGSNRLVGTITTTYQSGDPVTMTDGSLQNVHEIRKIVFSNAAAGSGDFDFGTIAGIYVDAILIMNNLKKFPIITTSTSNGQTIQVSIVGSGPFTYNNDIYKYSYYIDRGLCHLSFKIIFDITDGAVIDRIDVPLPVGIVKSTTATENFAFRGICKFQVPTATSNYGDGTVYSDFGGAEGQRVSIIRNMQTEDITWETGTTATLRGQICFPLA